MEIKEVRETQSIQLKFKSVEPSQVITNKPNFTEEKKAEILKTTRPIETITSKSRSFPVEFEQKEIEKKSQERIRKLKDLSIKLRTPDQIEELESTPAYIRRKVELSDVQHSSETEISRYTLGEDENKQTEMKTSNSFLHDNVD